MKRFIAASLLAGVSAKPKAEIDAMKHDVQQIYQKNFDSIIGTSLPLTVSAVLYFRGSNRADQAAIEVLDEVAKKSKKMLKIAAMDCDGSEAHCKRVGVESTPHVQLYPRTPQPNFKYDGNMAADDILKMLYKLMPGDKINTFKSVEEFHSFKKKNPTKPKIILFSEKKKAPTILKGLCTDSVFARTVEFAFVGSDADEVATDAGAKKKKMPAIMMVSKGKTTWYKEKDVSFLALHEWINVNSESGMGDTVKSADGASEVEAEEAEYEKVRELHSKSQGELCFKQKNVCAIYLSDGAMPDKVADQLVGYESRFAPKADRGVKYNWMWLDVSVEKEFKSSIEEQEKKQAVKEDRDLEPFTYPTMIFVKPPKKKREEKMLSYIRLDSGKTVSTDNVSAMVERIAGGATYTRSDLPKFVNRPKPKKGAKTEL